ncbi:tyrosine--tRNA ligase [Candidatus Dependentiae bacterium]|nr:tyrosine--tRNA ligase [Candidatus Dependentiae bacterium]
MNKQEVLEKLRAGTEQVIPQEAFIKKLELGRPLRIKLGADPTSADLHLGHAVVLSKLRQFQDMGHEVIFLIGDFTARIGDPTGRSKTRPALTDEQIAYNTETYFNQVSKVLDPAKITIRYNSEWLDKLSSREWVSLCGKVTLARLIEREDFATRIDAQQPIGFHELLYPLMQGYDSVALHADVELGGTDQTFNLLMGRYLQEHYGQEPQVILTVPLLEGLDGINKMSKSLGNAIGLSEPAGEAYGKLMSLSDDLMWRYYSVVLHKTAQEIESMKHDVAQNIAHPMVLKKALAHAIITRFWSPQEADVAQQVFEELFQKKDYSNAQQVDLSSFYNKDIWILDILKELEAVTSSSEGRRLVEAGAVTINGEKIVDPKNHTMLKPDMYIKVGKHRFYKTI